VLVDVLYRTVTAVTIEGGIVGEVVGVYSVWWDCGIGSWCVQCLVGLWERLWVFTVFGGIVG
jgi:hypothetical protein